MTMTLVYAQTYSEGTWFLKWRGSLKTFNVWAEMPIFDINCFIIQFQLHIVLQKQQKT